MFTPQPEPLYQPRGSGNRNRPMRPSGVWGKLKGVIGLLAVVGIFLYLLLPEDPRKLIWGPEPVKEKEVAKVDSPRINVDTPRIEETPKPSSNPITTTKPIIANVEETTAAGEQRQQVAKAKLKQQEFVRLAKDANDAIEQWQSEFKTCNKLIDELLTNDDGKALAGNPMLLSQFVAVSEEPRPTISDAGDLRTSVEILVQPMQISFKEPADASIPDEDMKKQLTEFTQKARAGRDANRKAKELVETLVSRAKLKGSTSSVTLKVALKQLHDQELARRAAMVEETRKKAQEAGIIEGADNTAEMRALKESARQAHLKARREEALGYLDDPEFQTIAVNLMRRGLGWVATNSFDSFACDPTKPPQIVDGALVIHDYYAGRVLGDVQSSPIREFNEKSAEMTYRITQVYALVPEGELVRRYQAGNGDRQQFRREMSHARTRYLGSDGNPREEARIRALLQQTWKAKGYSIAK